MMPRTSHGNDIPIKALSIVIKPNQQSFASVFRIDCQNNEGHVDYQNIHVYIVGQNSHDLKQNLPRFAKRVTH